MSNVKITNKLSKTKRQPVLVGQFYQHVGTGDCHPCQAQASLTPVPGTGDIYIVCSNTCHSTMYYSLNNIESGSPWIELRLDVSEIFGCDDFDKFRLIENVEITIS